MGALRSDDCHQDCTRRPSPLAAGERAVPETIQDEYSRNTVSKGLTESEEDVQQKTTRQYGSHFEYKATPGGTRRGQN